MAPDEARRAAARSFGVVDRVKDDVRDTWLSRVAETLAQDVRYGIRSLRRSPGFALVVIGTMALGVGANTAIFSVVNGVLLKPLPYRNGDALVVLHQQQPLAGVDDMRFSYKEIADYRDAAQRRGCRRVPRDVVHPARDSPSRERVGTGVVSASFFDVLGVTPLYGRAFVEADDKPGAPAVLMLSHKYWQRAFGGDPAVVGRMFRMNDRPHQVVGILPPVPQYPTEVDVYMPTSACPFRSRPGDDCVAHRPDDVGLRAAAERRRRSERPGPISTSSPPGWQTTIPPPTRRRAATASAPCRCVTR